MKFKKITAVSTAIIIASLNLVGCGSKSSEENKEKQDTKSRNGSRCWWNK